MNHKKNRRNLKSILALSAALLIGAVSAQTNTPTQPSAPTALTLEQRQEQRALVSIQQAERAQTALKNLPAATGKDFGAKYYLDTSAALYKEARSAFDAKKFFEAERKADASTSLVQGLVALYQANGLSVPQGLAVGGRGGPDGLDGRGPDGRGPGGPGMQGRSGQMGPGGAQGGPNQGGRGQMGPGQGGPNQMGQMAQGGRMGQRGPDAANIATRLDESLNRLKLEQNYYKAGDARVGQLITRAEDLVKQAKAAPATTTQTQPNTQNQARSFTPDPKLALSRAALETMQAAQALISAARGF